MVLGDVVLEPNGRISRMYHGRVSSQLAGPPDRPDQVLCAREEQDWNREPMLSDLSSQLKLEPFQFIWLELNRRRLEDPTTLLFNLRVKSLVLECRLLRALEQLIARSLILQCVLQRADLLIVRLVLVLLGRLLSQDPLLVQALELSTLRAPHDCLRRDGGLWAFWGAAARRTARLLLLPLQPSRFVGELLHSLALLCTRQRRGRRRSARSYQVPGPLLWTFLLLK